MGKDRPRRARHRNLQSGAKALGFLGVRLAGGRNALEHDPEKCEAVFREDHAQNNDLTQVRFQILKKPVKEFVVATRAKKTAKGKKKAVKKAAKKAAKALVRKAAKKVKK